MKTLDEVIKACEETVSDVDRGVDIEGCYLGATETRDALHYLKEYREKVNTRIYIPEGYTREKTGFTHQDFANTFREEPHFIRDVMVGTSQNLCNTSQNDPLTWDELRTMERKPVWVVVDGKERWRIIREVTNEHLILESGLPLHKSWMNRPDGWQAYRKERE